MDIRVEEGMMLKSFRRIQSRERKGRGACVGICLGFGGSVERAAGWTSQLWDEIMEQLEYDTVIIWVGRGAYVKEVESCRVDVYEDLV